MTRRLVDADRPGSADAEWVRPTFGYHISPGRWGGIAFSLEPWWKIRTNGRSRTYVMQAWHPTSTVMMLSYSYARWLRAMMGRGQT